MGQMKRQLLIDCHSGKDIDFGHARREEVIQYLYQTYGARHVGMACTVQTYHLRGAVRDVGKVFGLPAPTLEAVAKRVRQGLDASLAQAVAAVVGEAALRNTRWTRFVTLCEQLVGTPRHLGIHNGGYLGYEYVPSTTYTSMRTAARSARRSSVNSSALPP